MAAGFKTVTNAKVQVREWCWAVITPARQHTPKAARYLWALESNYLPVLLFTLELEACGLQQIEVCILHHSDLAGETSFHRWEQRSLLAAPWGGMMVLTINLFCPLFSGHFYSRSSSVLSKLVLLRPGLTLLLAASLTSQSTWHPLLVVIKI